MVKYICPHSLNEQIYLSKLPKNASLLFSTYFESSEGNYLLKCFTLFYNVQYSYFEGTTLKLLQMGKYSCPKCKEQFKKIGEVCSFAKPPSDPPAPGRIFFPEKNYLTNGWNLFDTWSHLQNSILLLLLVTGLLFLRIQASLATFKAVLSHSSRLLNVHVLDVWMWLECWYLERER